ncbi:L-lactate dehydrogenase [Mumia sp. zg.B17]|uniref:L-lactate dehydrogenase n=1 Tax=Mumia sp. zg.B17 TaxID=2855446 RepID=UPI001C6F3213|nr:L-lactate dehydrogenase [Mumia sp. zg.B17]MBW9205901.1 L-lactate dehydrogenase [Mumia sp. zg.B17]
MADERPGPPAGPRTSRRGAKIAVCGAGSVGSTVAYAALLRGLAGEIVLYDIASTLVEAQAHDLNDGAAFASPTTIVGSDDPAACAGADLVVMTAGARQKPGQTRLDLAGVNVGITRDVLGAVREVAPDAVYVLVTNPCDVLTYAAIGFLDLPPGRVFGSGTVLDTARLRYLLSRRLAVSPRSVHAAVAGEHGDSEIVLWSSANIGGVPIAEYDLEGRSLDPSEYAAIRETVAGSAYKVIEGKGATNFAIGLAAADIMSAVLRDEHRFLPVSTLFTGQYGIDDVCLSAPCVVSASGVAGPAELPLDETDLAGLRSSAATLRSQIDSLGLASPVF